MKLGTKGSGRLALDEGADFRNYTYAKYGRELLCQPGMFAWQVFDGRGISMLRDIDRPINPVVKDGRSTRGLAIPKSNWAYPISEPPFEAYAVTTGITFTFGGLKIDPEGSVQNSQGKSIGGLFYHNYPGGSGLTAGAVLGRIAGQSAAGYGKSGL